MKKNKALNRNAEFLKLIKKCKNYYDLRNIHNNIDFDYIIRNIRHIDKNSVLNVIPIWLKEKYIKEEKKYVISQKKLSHNFKTLTPIKKNDIPEIKNTKRKKKKQKVAIIKTNEINWLTQSSVYKTIYIGNMKY